VPAVAGVEEVKLDRPMTLLAGENGSGKSTILEAVAEAIGFAEQGASSTAWASCRRCPATCSTARWLRCSQAASRATATTSVPGASNRFGRDGLYLLDEPEAALSVPGELALLAIIARAVSVGAQFVVATHSPILLACRDARIYELDGTGVTAPDYDDLQAVSLTRGFLAAPERYLRALDSDALEEGSW